MNSFKSFSNFSEGLEEIVKVVPDIKNICDAVCVNLNIELKDITPKDLAKEFSQIVIADFPYVDFRSPAVSISYREVGFKSRNAFSFGWKYITTGFGSLQYSFRISFFSHSDTVKEIEDKLNEMGWAQTTEKHNFFPYKNNKNKKDNKSFKRENKPVKKEKEVVKQEVESEVTVAEGSTVTIGTPAIVEEVKSEEIKNTSSEY